MRRLRFILLLFMLILALSGLSACTRTRTPLPTSDNTVGSATEHFAASPGEILPRYTPHVTLPAPPPAIVTLTPILIEMLPSPTPAPPPTPPTPSPNTTLYTVQPGDTLYDIAQKHRVSLPDLARINHITDPTTIMIGQQLLIP